MSIVISLPLDQEFLNLTPSNIADPTGQDFLNLVERDTIFHLGFRRERFGIGIFMIRLEQRNMKDWMYPVISRQREASGIVGALGHVLNSEGTNILGMEFLFPMLELDVTRGEHNLITFLEVMRAAEPSISVRLLTILSRLEEALNPGQGGGHVLKDTIQIGKLPFRKAQGYWGSWMVAMIQVVRGFPCRTGFCIVHCKGRERKEVFPCLVISVDEVTQDLFKDTISPLRLPICLRMESGGESGLGLEAGTE